MSTIHRRGVLLDGIGKELVRSANGGSRKTLSDWIGSLQNSIELEDLAETFTSGDATPDVSGSSKWITAGSTAITNFDGGTEGQVIHVYRGDSDIAITDNGNIDPIIAGNLTLSAARPSASFRLASGVWKQVAEAGALSAAMTPVVQASTTRVARRAAGAGNRVYANDPVFGLVFDGSTDNSEALDDLKDHMASFDYPPVLVFGGESDTLNYSVSPNWAINNLEIIAEGEARLRYTGTDHGFIVDPGSGQHVNNVRIGSIILEGTSAMKDGFWARGFSRSRIRGLQVRSAGAAYAGIRIFHSTLPFLDEVTVTVNAESWVDQKPAYGIVLGNISNPSVDCVCWGRVRDAAIEGPNVGIYCEEAWGTVFDGGTYEACSSKGLVFSQYSRWNKVSKVGLEANTTSDIEDGGYGNDLIGPDTQTLVHYTSTARYGKVICGSHKSIQIDAGARAIEVMSGTVYNRENDGGTITNNGTDCVIHPGVVDGGKIIRESAQRRVFRLGDKGIFAGATLPSGWATKLGSGDTAVRMANGLGGGVEMAAGNNVAGSYATNGVQLDQGILQWYAVSGGLQIEFGGVDFDSVANVSWFFGFTDQFSSLEMPFYSAASGDTITSDTSNGFGFLFDTAMATDNWWLVGCKANTDATPQNVGSAPTAGTPSRLRIHVTDAGTATFFINDTQVGSAMANAVTTSTLLTPVVAGFSRTNAYKAAYVKYIDAEVRR